ncbi:DUF4421 domain-containing protein [Bacteroidota bacterium]
MRRIGCSGIKKPRLFGPGNKAVIITAGIFFTSTALVFSSPEVTYEPDSDSTEYIIDKTDLLSIRFYPLAKYNSLEIKGPVDRLSMQPNGTGSLGFGFNYKFLGFGFSIGIPASAESIEKYGKTRRFDFQMSYYGRKLAADAYFQEYSGYYLANPSAVTTWNENYYPQSEDLRIASIGGTVHYIFNSEKYSYKAAYLRNQIQNKSAGSFTIGVFAFYDEIRSSSGLIPDILPDSVRRSINIKEFSAASIGITGGYMYTFVIKGNFFVNVGLSPGFGYRNFIVKTMDGSWIYANKLGTQIQTRIALGYEFRRFYLGATSSTILRNFIHEDTEVNIGTGQVRLIIGTRFDVSGKRAGKYIKDISE